MTFRPATDADRYASALKLHPNARVTVLGEGRADVFRGEAVRSLADVARLVGGAPGEAFRWFVRDDAHRTIAMGKLVA